eukprot:maker-scaffold_53-snap-gene-0.36-mRNA-1 protein AED:0.01 eAED:0.01 QI:72/1/1/1/1/1/2/253/386
MTLDMFADDSSESDVEAEEDKKIKKRKDATQLNTSLKRNKTDLDDSEGYYITQNGEVLNDKYKVLSDIGRGVFSSVLLCENIETKQTNAIKIIRNNKLMSQAATREVIILKSVKGAPYVIQLEETFSFQNHICIVFESMKTNLRNILTKYGRNVGLNISSISTFARHLFTGLKFLKKKYIVHADLKLDNILVNEKLSLVKIADLGSAFQFDLPNLTEKEKVPYLGSRFYRAPETLLGLQNTCAIDVWALAVCLFELYSGKVMFQGSSNNEMLDLIMKNKGRFPNRLVRKHLNAYLSIGREFHFEPKTYNFRKISGERIVSVVISDKPEKSVGKRVMDLLKKNATVEEKQKASELGILLERATGLDPLKRIDPSEALKLDFTKKKIL